MTTPTSATDPLFDALDPLVRDGTLTASQADQVYIRVSSAGATPPAAPTTPMAQVADPSQRPDGSGWLTAAAMAGSGLAFAALLLSSTLASDDGFHWKSFLLTLAITVGFAVAAVLSRWPLARRRGTADVLTGVLATLAVVALAVAVVTPDDANALGYVAGLVLLAGGLAGYWFLQSDILTVAAVLGGGVLLAQIASDTVDVSNGDFSGPVLMVGVFFLAYGVVVVAAGWRFSCRHLTGLLGSIIAVASMHVVALVLLLVAIVGSIGTALGSDDGGVGAMSAVRGDLRIALILGLSTAVAVAGLYGYSRLPRYAVVSFIGAALLPLLVTNVLARDHPLRWTFAYAVLGGLVVAGAAAQRWLAHRSATTATSPSQPG